MHPVGGLKVKTEEKEKIRKIIENDETKAPSGFPKLFYGIYNGKVHIMGLFNKTFKKYKIN